MGKFKSRKTIQKVVSDSTRPAFQRLKSLLLRHLQEAQPAFKAVALENIELIRLQEAREENYRELVESNGFETFLLYWVLPFSFLFLMWGYLFRPMGVGPNVMIFGKSRARIFAVEVKNKITFKEVTGIDEAVQEIQEIVAFLKNPTQYPCPGSKISKGVLLVGPSGSGKTLLAKAVVGEAGVFFFSISGSEFVEMFVGVAAVRVRDLFAQAKQKAPCIVFIDEIDAIGRSRAAGTTLSGHDERKNALNQLLVEMDGFDSSKGVIIMAATNRPDVLVPALFRPRCFECQIMVDRSDLNSRMAIFKVHISHLPLADDVDAKFLAAQTPGYVGADIANVCNEAAWPVALRGKSKIHMADFQEAIERVVAGLKKPIKVINQQERRVVAYHESGHALVGNYLPHGEFVANTSIVPRGGAALGYTLQTTLEDRYLLIREELQDKIIRLLGGWAAEGVAFQTICIGAANDMERATEIACNMVLGYGMSKRLPNFSLAESNKAFFLAAPPREKFLSDKTAQIIDQEVQEIIDDCYRRARERTIQHCDKLEILAQTLQTKAVVDRKEVEMIPRNPQH